MPAPQTVPFDQTGLPDHSLTRFAYAAVQHNKHALRTARLMAAAQAPADFITAHLVAQQWPGPSLEDIEKDYSPGIAAIVGEIRHVQRDKAAPCSIAAPAARASLVACAIEKMEIMLEESKGLATSAELLARAPTRDGTAVKQEGIPTYYTITLSSYLSDERSDVISDVLPLSGKTGLPLLDARLGGTLYALSLKIAGQDPAPAPKASLTA